MTINFEQLFQQALAEHLNNNLDEAERLYKKTLEIEPKHPDACHNLGIIEYSKNKLDIARQLFKKAIEINPHQKEFWKSYDFALINDERNGYSRQVNINEKDTKQIKSTHNLNLSESKFNNPKPLEYKEFYRAGMGTENVGGLLRSLIHMIRPNRILEVGAGYTSPFLLEGVINNEKVYDDGNLKDMYLKNLVYDPKIVIIDNMEQGKLLEKPGMKDLLSSKYIDFVDGNFEDKADILFKKYGFFDFVWFDCGGPDEYQIFMDRYWNKCSNYVLFHYTYTNGKPNQKKETILKNLKDDPEILDIIEPHKKRQANITLVKKKYKSTNE